LILAKQYLEESIKISQEFKTDNDVIADFMKNQTEIFQQISDLIEPEEIINEIESITMSRIIYLIVLVDILELSDYLILLVLLKSPILVFVYYKFIHKSKNQKNSQIKHKNI